MLVLIEDKKSRDNFAVKVQMLGKDSGLDMRYYNKVLLVIKIIPLKSLKDQIFVAEIGDTLK